MRTISVQMPDGQPYVVQRLLTHEKSNAKLRKSSGSEWLLYGLSLAPSKVSGHQVCASSSVGCRKACIFTSGMGGYPTVGQGRIARTLAWFQKRDDFKEKLLEELSNASKLADRQGKQLAVRLNVFSDIVWEQRFPEIFTEFPDVQFYDYSKHYNRMLDFIGGRIPPNYYLTFSRSENNWDECVEVLNSGRNVSIPFTVNKVMRPDTRVPLPKRYMGYRVINGEKNDLRFKDKQGCVVGVFTKGLGFWDETGFTVSVVPRHVKGEKYEHVTTV